MPNIDISQLIKFKNQFENVDKELPKFLHDFILEMAHRVIAQTKSLTPVDTGDLRKSWEISNVRVSKHYVDVDILNPIEYASFVENGHWQRRRWLPGTFVGNKFKYSGYGSNTGTGIMLSNKWIPGHYMARISLAKIEAEIPKRFEKQFNRWMHNMLGG